jgi:Cof subfamily protein (haloacid dehalogenase superfamily)
MNTHETRQKIPDINIGIPPELRQILPELLRYIPPEAIIYGRMLVDVDDTLTNRARIVTPQTVAAVTQFQSTEGKLAVCTGRHYATLRAKVLSLFPPEQLHITCGGAQIIDSKGTLIWEQAIPGSDIAELLTVTEASGCGYGFGLGEKYYGDMVMQRRMTNKQPDVLLGDVTEIDFDQHHIPLLVISRLNDQMRKHLEEFSQAGRLAWKEMTSQDGTPYADVTAAGVDKQTGIEQWLQLTDTDGEKLVRVGDSLNDVPMISRGVGIAMGNAHPEIKKLARFILPDSNENGLAELLNLLSELRLALH